MSGWHYAAKKFVRDFGEEIEYGLVEVYPSLDGAYTENAVTIFAESPKELAKWLRLAADDVEKYDAVEEESDELQNS